MKNLTDDKLNRKDFLNDLFNLFDNFGNYDDGGLTISINGKYGSGKSTLLNFIDEKNKEDQKYHIIKYDAWQNNLFDNPLIPILYSLNKLETTGSKILSGAKSVLKSIPKIFTNTLANAYSMDLSSLMVNENIFAEYNKYIEEISKYKKILADFCKNKKVILLIDELDRCLPEYQIKVLETLYNVFNIPNLILVIAIDRTQLEHTVKNIFGNEQNVSGYLSKFIQYEIDLPDEENNKYLQTLISFNCAYPEVKNICSKIVDELNLICNEKDSEGESIQHSDWYPLFVCLVLIIKKLQRNIYKKYFYYDKIFENIMENLPINQTPYKDFLNDISNTCVEDILNFFTSKKMNFAFILYWINYFYPIRHIEINSLIDYTHIHKERIVAISKKLEIALWGQTSFNGVLNKIRIFK